MEHEFSEDGEELYMKAGQELAGKKRLQDQWRAKGLRWQRSIHGEDMMLGVNLA